MADKPAFVNAPEPRQGPDIPYKNIPSGNPVLRGYLLVILATIVSSSTFIQNIFWRLNGFDKLKDWKELKDYDPRHDPTVVPSVDESEAEVVALQDLPQPRQRPSPSSYYTCTDYHELYKSGKLTPTQVVDYILPLIDRGATPPGKHSVSFLSVRPDEVRAAAQASTERYKAGRPLSVLDGVPLAVKDEVDLKGHKKTYASRIDFTNPKDETGWCIEKWIDAGGVVLGKTNMHQVGMDTSGNNPHTGTPLNPHNQGYYTGGSSSGSACITAEGICPITLGVDGGGSIRLPAGFCGVYGLKTTHGRVSPRPTKDAGNSVAVYGPIASSVDDLALGYRIMAQPDFLNGHSANFPNSMSTSAFNTSTRQTKTIGIYRTWVDRSDPPVRKMFEEALNYFVKAHNYDIVDITIPLLPEGQKAHALTILSEARSSFSAQQISQLTHHNQLILNVTGNHATAQDFLFAQRMRNLLMCHLAWLWEQHPGMLILTPTTPCAGWKIGHPSDITSGHGCFDGDMSIRTMEYLTLANFCGCPAISCPMGYADGEVPVGIMAMGEWGSEEQLLAWGKDGEGMLGNDGIRRPSPEGAWIDVISEASKL